jgi:serine/threonine-protein phosphatase with EF-hands
LNNLDSLDEGEIERLVRFKSIVMDYVPVLAQRANEKALASVNDTVRVKFGEDDGELSESAASGKRETAVDEALKLQNLKVATKSKATANLESMGVVLSDINLLNVDSAGCYDIPSGPLQYQAACEILEVYKHGGRLSENTAHRVLRAAYRSLSKLPNVSRLNLVEAEEKLTVVGDLHGQLSDLIYIFEESGLPTTKSKYIFNGDFVDRGLEGVEITLILLAFHVALPGSVYLNRGNHEDYMIMCNYGFQEECSSKYNMTTFGMVSEVFQHLPLMTVVNDAVLVVHGGLFHDVDVRLADMDAFVRCEFSLLDIPEDGETLDGIDKKTNLVEYHKQLQRDALWSDPCAPTGKNESARGAGIAFGPDVTACFLMNNDLSLVVRSHECVQHGFDYPYKNVSGYENILCTLFSASNYGGSSNNRGAFMEFRMAPGPNSMLPTAYTFQEVIKKDLDVPVPGANLVYAVHEYHITAEMERMMKRAFTAHAMSIHEIILRKQDKLLRAFRSREVANKTGNKETNEFSNYVTTEDWLAVMAEVTGAEVHWGSMIAVLVPPSSRNPDNNTIHYADFINQFTLDQRKHLDRRRLSRRKSSNKNLSASSPDGKGGSIGLEAIDERYNAIEGLYTQYKELKLVFEFFDARDCGELTVDDFVKGCEKINETLPPQSRLQNIEELFDIADLDGSKVIIANEFFEVFRIVDMRPNAAASPIRSQPVSDLDALLEEDEVDDSDLEVGSESDDDTVVPEVNARLTRKDTMEVKGHIINAL